MQGTKGRWGGDQDMLYVTCGPPPPPWPRLSRIVIHMCVTQAFSQNLDCLYAGYLIN